MFWQQQTPELKFSDLAFTMIVSRIAAKAMNDPVDALWFVSLTVVHRQPLRAELWCKASCPALTCLCPCMFDGPAYS
jgi:hypothetical protein